ncbi:hypothetical protein [Campylobacter sp. 19-13652]|uniref:hypothetical protein n=1 Tax=Campylobacter sp. 19-13652 TaxID=2840180 RepID=UPI001C75D7FA|nr:hypothetical protein LBC_01060 [Campylobacter sp. 19-13652]
MKKTFAFSLALASAAMASDPITIDSLFKNQIGLRSVTSLSFLSSGNANVYTSFPTLTIQGDPVVWDNTKKLSLNQTLMYALNSKLDLIATFGGSYTQNEYQSYTTLEPKSESRTQFDTAWLGVNYRGDRIGELVPMLTAQAALYQKERALRESKNFYLKSYSLKASLKGYSDPAIYSLYAGFGYNAKRKFSFASVKYGNTFFFGGDLSVILSPKITLDLGIEQRLQTASKTGGRKTSSLRSIPTYSVGSTYSLSDDTSISFNASLGGGSAAPDSVFSFSLWQKF